MEENAKKASEQIQKILEENELALQPFLAFSENGVLPRVRLVSTKNEDNEQTGDSEASGESKESDDSAEPEQS